MTVIAAILLTPFAILTAFFTAEVLAGLPRSRTRLSQIEPASAVIVVPAHDEATVIGATLRRLLDALGDRMRVLVVADNCADATADEARRAGAEVIERRDPQRPGKGHALAFAAQHLAVDPPAVMVVLDADCEIDRPSLRALVDAAAASKSPGQAVNLLRPDKGSTPLVQLSTFAFMLKNLVRQRGLQRLAGRVHLTGTGMAMPFGMFRTSSQVRASIVEDLALGLELAASGHAPKLVPGAHVWSGSASQHGTLIQRRRWEGGFIATAVRQGPRALAHGLARLNVREMLAALDLMIPPLALFGALNAGVLLIAALATMLTGGEWWPVLIQLALLVAAGLSVLLAWIVEGRQFMSAAVLARIPLYLLWKLPLYLGLARGGAPREWLRTGR